MRLAGEVSEELDSVVCDACGKSMLIGHDTMAQIAGLYYHDWCYGVRPSLSDHAIQGGILPPRSRKVRG